MTIAANLALVGGGLASASGVLLALRHVLRAHRDRARIRRRLSQTRHLCHVCDPWLAQPRGGFGLGWGRH